MKPIIQFNKKSSRDHRASRRGSSFPQIDYSLQAGTITAGGRCFGSRRPSFRSISQDYFKNEAPHNYVREAALFSVIVMTAAVPIVNSVSALLHLVRSFGSL